MRRKGVEIIFIPSAFTPGDNDAINNADRWDIDIPMSKDR